MRHLVLCAALLTSVPAVLACAGLDDIAESLQGKPPPPELADMIGTWTGDGATMTISPEGELHHKTQKGSATTEFNAPIKEWHSDRFVAGIGPVTQEFKIDSPPAGGKRGWRMTINGTDLRRGK